MMCWRTVVLLVASIHVCHAQTDTSKATNTVFSTSQDPQGGPAFQSSVFGRTQFQFPSPATFRIGSPRAPQPSVPGNFFQRVPPSRAPLQQPQRFQPFQPEPQRFRPEPQRFPAESQRFPAESQRFQSESQRFRPEPQRFQPEQQQQQLRSEPQRFQAEPQRFSPTPQQLRVEPQRFQEQQRFQPEAPRFQQGSQNFQPEPLRFQPEQQRLRPESQKARPESRVPSPSLSIQPSPSRQPSNQFQRLRQQFNPQKQAPPQSARPTVFPSSAPFQSISQNPNQFQPQPNTPRSPVFLKDSAFGFRPAPEAEFSQRDPRAFFGTTLNQPGKFVPVAQKSNEFRNAVFSSSSSVAPPRQRNNNFNSNRPEFDQARSSPVDTSGADVTPQNARVFGGRSRSTTSRPDSSTAFSPNNRPVTLFRLVTDQPTTPTPRRGRTLFPQQENRLNTVRSATHVPILQSTVEQVVGDSDLQHDLIDISDKLSLFSAPLPTTDSANTNPSIQTDSLHSDGGNQTPIENISKIDPLLTDYQSFADVVPSSDTIGITEDLKRLETSFKSDPSVSYESNDESSSITPTFTSTEPGVSEIFSGETEQPNVSANEARTTTTQEISEQVLAGSTTEAELSQDESTSARLTIPQADHASAESTTLNESPSTTEVPEHTTLPEENTDDYYDDSDYEYYNYDYDYDQEEQEDSYPQTDESSQEYENEDGDSLTPSTEEGSTKLASTFPGSSSTQTTSTSTLTSATSTSEPTHGNNTPVRSGSKDVQKTGSTLRQRIQERLRSGKYRTSTHAPKTEASTESSTSERASTINTNDITSTAGDAPSTDETVPDVTSSTEKSRIGQARRSRISSRLRSGLASLLEKQLKEAAQGEENEATESDINNSTDSEVENKKDISNTSEYDKDVVSTRRPSLFSIFRQVSSTTEQAVTYKASSTEKTTTTSSPVSTTTSPPSTTRASRSRFTLSAIRNRGTTTTKKPPASTEGPQHRGLSSLLEKLRGLTSTTTESPVVGSRQGKRLNIGTRLRFPTRKPRLPLLTRYDKQDEVKENPTTTETIGTTESIFTSTALSPTTKDDLANILARLPAGFQIKSIHTSSSFEATPPTIALESHSPDTFRVQQSTEQSSTTEGPLSGEIVTNGVTSSLFPIISTTEELSQNVLGNEQNPSSEEIIFSTVAAAKETTSEAAQSSTESPIEAPTVPSSVFNIFGAVTIDSENTSSKTTESSPETDVGVTETTRASLILPTDGQVTGSSYPSSTSVSTAETTSTTETSSSSTAAVSSSRAPVSSTSSSEDPLLAGFDSDYYEASLDEDDESLRPGLCSANCRLVGALRIVAGLQWSSALKVRGSPEWSVAAELVSGQLTHAFMTSPLAVWFDRVEIDSFSEGSVIVHYTLFFNNLVGKLNTEDVRELFQEDLPHAAIPVDFIAETTQSARQLGDLAIDPGYTEFYVDAPLVSRKESEEDYLIPEWLIAVIVIGLTALLFMLIFGVVVLWNRRKRNRSRRSALPLTADVLSELDKSYMSGIDNLAVDPYVYDPDEAWDDEKVTHQRQRGTNQRSASRSRDVISSKEFSIYDSWGSDYSATHAQPRRWSRQQGRRVGGDESDEDF